jgi:NADH dehydrogenase FAD-containing subunit
VLLDTDATILRPFPESLQRRTVRQLDTNTEDQRLRRIEAATKIWAAGVEASPVGRMVAEAAGARIDRAGRCT